MSIQSMMLSALVALTLTATQAPTANAANVQSIYTGQRVSRTLFSTGDFVIFAKERENLFAVVNYKTGATVATIASDSDFPSSVLALPGGDLIGVSLEGNQATLINGKTFKKKATLNLGGYTDDSGEFVPYWMMSGCAMANGDSYFVSSTDVALVRVAKGAKKGKLVATQESAGLSGSTEVACAGGKLFVANHRSMLDPSDDQILVLSTAGKVIETINAPGLMHLQGDGNTLVITSAPTPATHGSVQFADASGAHLKVVANEVNDNFPQWMTFDHAGKRILVAEKSPAAYVSFDATTFQMISRHPFSSTDGITTPRGIACSSDGKTVFLESEGSVSAVTE